MEKSLDILTDSKPEGNLKWNQFGKSTHAEFVTSSRQTLCLLVLKMCQVSKAYGNWLKAIRLYLRKKKASLKSTF